MNQQDSQKARGVAAAAGLVSLATMISRILGLLREMVMARFFGAGRLTDAFNVAYRIPNLLRDLFAEGALSSAFLPTFVHTLHTGGKAQAWRLANVVINALLVILGVLTLLIYFGARGLVYLLAIGFTRQPDKFELTVQMTQIMAPFLLFVALAAVVMGILNACGLFFVPALAPSAFNLCCILAGIFLSPHMQRFGLEPIVSMAMGALVGGASQFFVQLPAARGQGYRYQPVLSFSDPGLRRMGRLMTPAIIGLSATQINILVDNQIASYYGDGPVSWLNYAFRLMQLPIGIFGVAVATANLSAVSQFVAQNDIERVRATVTSSLRMAACLTFPATIGLIIFREDIVRLLYERGSFSVSDTRQTASVLLLYALALFAYSAVKVLVPTFYALGDTKTPVRTSVLTVVFKVGINFLLLFPMQFQGLALATATASWLNFGLLVLGLNRRIESRWGWQETAVYLRILLASLGVGVVALVTHRIAGALLPDAGLLGLVARLGSAIAAGAASTLPLLQFCGVPEVSKLSELARRRLFGRRR